jgi:hypothetical protein
MAQHRQPPPLPGVQDVTPALIADLQGRAAEGLRTYGRPLQTNNGRNALQDALEEALDLAQYLKQACMEQEAEKARIAEEGAFRDAAVVSSVVCYGCGRLIHANEVQPAAVVLEVGDDGAMAFYCRCACAGLKDGGSPQVREDEHRGRGAFRNPNGSKSDILVKCDRCGQGFDPTFSRTRKGCPGSGAERKRPTHGA